MDSYSHTVRQSTPLGEERKYCYDDQDSELLEDRGGLPPHMRRHHQRRDYCVWHKWRVGLEVLLLGCSAVLLLSALYQKPSSRGIELACGSLSRQWRTASPYISVKTKIADHAIVPEADGVVGHETRRFKGSFRLQSPWTGVGPEVDSAWGNITNGGAIGITKEQWEAVNEYHDYPVMLDEDHGTGQYLASLDVFHQLHCVDLLRKSTHREYYDEHEGSFAGASQRVIEGHLEHCVETLRQTLMCHGDMSLLTYNWVEGRAMPYPNFNTIHTCKRWDDIVAWNMRRDVTTEWVDGVGRKMLSPPVKPKDVAGMATPP